MTSDTPDRDIMVLTDSSEYEWQCTMCGYVVTMKRRPGYCPDCNCMDGDTLKPPFTRLFIRREACGWFE